MGVSITEIKQAFDFSNQALKLIEEQGGPNGIDRFLKGELYLAESQLEWYEDDGVIYFNTTFTSDGTTGEKWIERLSNKGVNVSPYAQNILRSHEFKPTCGVSYKLAVLKGSLFNNSERVPQIIDYEARRRGLKKPPPEVACLVKERMAEVHLIGTESFRMIAMHEPIIRFDGLGNLLCILYPAKPYGLFALHTEAILHCTYNFLYII